MKKRAFLLLSFLLVFAFSFSSAANAQYAEGSYYLPSGRTTILTNTTIAGTVYDKDNPSVPLKVQIYVNGKYYMTVVANLGINGFWANVSIAKGSSITVYAKDINRTGNLTGKKQTIGFNKRPGGSAYIGGGQNEGYILGTAFDHDSIYKSTTVRIKKDGNLYKDVVANNESDIIVFGELLPGNHAWWLPVTSELRGHRVDAWALGVDTASNEDGYNKLLGTVYP